MSRLDDIAGRPINVVTLSAILGKANAALDREWLVSEWHTGRTVWFARSTPTTILEEARRMYLEAGWMRVYVVETSKARGLEFWRSQK